MLQLTRPLAFIDIESTGLNKETDRIIELAICIMTPDLPIQEFTFSFNPGIPIPAEATAIHGISDADVSDLQSFKEFAKSIHDMLCECDIAGFNSNAFDVPMLYFELLRAGITWDYSKCRMIDVGNIFKIREQRTLSAAVKFYTGQDHEDAHGAKADALATAEVLKAQFAKYPDLPATVNELALYSNYGKKMLDVSGKFAMDEKGVIILNFGPHKGKPAKENISFLDWMMSKDFAPDTKSVAMTVIHEDFESNENHIF
jgi:DNA polymerase III subunit epsilon